MTQEHPSAKTTPEQQRTAFDALLQSLGPATHEQVAAALAEREVVEPEEGLTPEIVEKLREAMASRKSD